MMRPKQNFPILLLVFAANNLLVHPQFTLADCLVEGDMMFVEGQSLGTFGMVCVNETSYDKKEKICGPNGEIVLVTTAQENCSISSGTPYCIQCGSVEQGVALCLGSMDIPEVCSLTSDTGDDAFGNTISGGENDDNNFEMLPPSTPSSGGTNPSQTFSTPTAGEESITFSAFDQCDNAADIDAWGINNISQDDGSIQFCTTEWNGGCYYQGDCTQDCFVELGFSEACSACFGDVVNCIVDNDCQSFCEFDENSEDCATCRLPCMEVFDECSGISTMLVNNNSSSTTTIATTTTASSTTTTAAIDAPSESSPSTPASTLTTSTGYMDSFTTTFIPPSPTQSPMTSDAPIPLPSPDGARTVVSKGHRLIAYVPLFVAKIGWLIPLIVFAYRG